jgi:hypothetical protein
MSDLAGANTSCRRAEGASPGQPVAETVKGLAWVPSQSGVKDNRIPRLGVAERASGAVKSVQSICLGPREILEVKILENRARVEDSTPVLALGVQALH